MLNKSYKICSKCVMDISDKNIKFNKDGICDHCLNYKYRILPKWKSQTKNSNNIKKLSDKIKKRKINNSEHDCIIGMSGGVDSSYLVYVAKEIMGLNPLVFHVDAGWNSDIAINNIERIVDSLNLDLYTEVINWEEMKELQLSFFKSGVPHIDAPQDHAFFSTMYSFALRHGIRNILTGANYSTECIRNPVEWMYYQSDSSQIKDIHKKYGKNKLKKFPFTSILWHKVWLPYFKKIKLFTPLNYINYEKKEAIKLLKKKFNWQPYTQKHFESRFTKFYESYWLYERFGYDVRRVQFSSLILTQQMTREDALEKLKCKPYDIENIHKDKEFIANKLDITLNELENFKTLPKKTFKDFANQYSIYKIGSYFLKKTGMETSVKR